MSDELVFIIRIPAVAPKRPCPAPAAPAKRRCFGGGAAWLCHEGEHPRGGDDAAGGGEEEACGAACLEACDAAGGGEALGSVSCQVAAGAA